MGKSGGEAAR